jgi:hypothetical protein
MYRGERDVVLILGVAFEEMYVPLSIITVNCKGDYTKQYDKFLDMMQILTKICKKKIVTREWIHQVQAMDQQRCHELWGFIISGYLSL